MKKLLLATVPTFALSLPAMANSQTIGQSQQSGSDNQVQQRQSQNLSSLNNRQQAQNTIEPSQLNKQQIRQIQQALNKQGFDVGHVDGRWGADTAKAVKDFQQRKQMQANGKLDQQTLQALSVNMTAQQNNRPNGVSPQQPSAATTGQGSSDNEPMQPSNNPNVSNGQTGSQQTPSGEQTPEIARSNP
jgi:hypothetical protein